MTCTVSPHNLGNYTVPPDSKGGTCIDIGANVGSFSKTYANHFSLIHAYEPFSGAFAMCQTQLRDLDHVVLYNEAVVDKPQKKVQIRTHLNGDSGSNAISSDILNSEWTEDLEQCSSVDLETALERIGGSVDFVKCDSETSEWFIFNHKDLSAIKYIALELHWQIGANKCYELISWMQRTHKLDKPFAFVPQSNAELLFTRSTD